MARPGGNKVQDVAMDIGEGQAFILPHQRIGRFAVAFGATYAHDFVRQPPALALFAASKAASRSMNLPWAGPDEAAIVGAGKVS